ncbi:MAG: hypothetical protein GTO24_21280 [candidate division Zixibacteria bacterium]|nr:hypothetical protein [candidate division Zixibacteria bacterium]
MNFSRTSLQVIQETKTQTRRLSKPGDKIYRHRVSRHKFTKYLYNEHMNRTRYEVGKTYAVQEGRGKKGLYYRYLVDQLQTAERDAILQATVYGNYTPESKLGRDLGWLEARILVKNIRLENLKDIKTSDACAEGILPDGVKVASETLLYVVGFVQEWNRLYPPGSKYCWDANPRVVVLDFELVKKSDKPRRRNRTGIAVP